MQAVFEDEVRAEPAATFVARKSGAMFELPINEDEYLEIHADAKDGRSVVTLRLFSRESGHVLDMPMDGQTAGQIALAIQTLAADAGLVAGNQRMKASAVAPGSPWRPWGAT